MSETCKACGGDGYNFEAGRPGHPLFMETCEPCKGTGVILTEEETVTKDTIAFEAWYEQHKILLPSPKESYRLGWMACAIHLAGL